MIASTQLQPGGLLFCSCPRDAGSQGKAEQRREVSVKLDLIRHVDCDNLKSSDDQLFRRADFSDRLRGSPRQCLATILDVHGQDIQHVQDYKGRMCISPLSDFTISHLLLIGWRHRVLSDMQGTSNQTAASCLNYGC